MKKKNPAVVFRFLPSFFSENHQLLMILGQATHFLFCQAGNLFSLLAADFRKRTKRGYTSKTVASSEKEPLERPCRFLTARQYCGFNTCILYVMETRSSQLGEASTPFADFRVPDKLTIQMGFQKRYYFN